MTASEKARKRIALRRRAVLYADAAMERTRQRYEAGEIHAQPSMITVALDAQGLEGPEVDTACLATEPDVDEWEAGLSAPSWPQLAALAALCDVTPEFLCREPREGLVPAIVCGSGGCEVVQPKPYVLPMALQARVRPLHRDTLW